MLCAGVLEIDSKLLVVREELGSGQFGVMKFYFSRIDGVLE